MRPSVALALAVALPLTLPGLALATTYSVGPARMYRTPCAVLAAGSAVTLAPGDIIEVDPGTYTDACSITASGSAAAPITLRGIPGGVRPVIDGTGMDLSGDGSTPRAVLQWDGASYWVVEHLEIRNGHNTSSNNAACVRLLSAAHEDTFRDLSLHDCDNGVFSSGDGTAYSVESSEVFANGANDGQTHNFYANGSSLRLVGNYVHDSRGGENVKSRAHYVELLYNLIANASEYDIDLIQDPTLTVPADSNAVMIGNVVVKSADSTNNKCVQFGSDDASAAAGRNGSLYAFHNTFVLNSASHRVFQALLPATSTRIYFVNNLVFDAAGGGGLGTTAATEALITGSNNWLSTGITPPAGLSATTMGDAPGFVGAGDYRLAAGSPAIDLGTASGLSYRDGAGMTQSGAAVMQFLAPAGTNPRAVAGSAPDVGAFESGAPAGDAGTQSGSDSGMNSADAGASADGGTGTSPGGCHCRARPGGGSGDGARGIAALACGAVMLARRRRRRTHPAQ